METTATATGSDLFLAKLRQTTLPAHKSLEALPISEKIISPDISSSEYALYLALMSRIVTDIEQNIFPLIKGEVPDIAQRDKHALIEADLQFLSPEKTFNDFPLQDAGYTFSPASAMGIMYVIEGSTLGGRVILKNIEKTLGYNAEQGAQYFAGYGTQTGPLWKSFMEMFTTFANTNKEEEIIAGAELAFTTIHNYLQKNS